MQGRGWDRKPDPGKIMSLRLSDLKIVYEDNLATIIHGDALDVLREMEAESVQACICSPPYWNLRDYGTARWEGGSEECDHKIPPKGGPNPERYSPGGGEMWRASNDGGYRDVCGKCGARRIDAQIGLESSPQGWYDKLVEVFREVRRVLRNDGVLWVNCGSCYQNKQELGLPWKLAFALQNDSWILRSASPWVKRSAMPESCQDRPASALEYMFLFAKNERYYFDMEAVRSPQESAARSRFYEPRDKEGVSGETRRKISEFARSRERDEAGLFIDMGRAFNNPKGGYQEQLRESRPPRLLDPAGRAFRNTDLFFQSIQPPHGLITSEDEILGFDVNPEPLPFQHYAAYPRKLVEPCILSGTSEAGCCANCGKPWVRVTKTEYNVTNPHRKAEQVKVAALGNSAAGAGFKYGAANKHSQTLGWTPSCTCDAGEPVPCVVLDPFAGSCTTSLRSKELGRRSISIELSEAYCEIGKHRLTGQMTLDG